MQKTMENATGGSSVSAATCWTLPNTFGSDLQDQYDNSCLFHKGVLGEDNLQHTDLHSDVAP